MIIADRTGRVLEAWSGFQVAWTMARGYKGAFGEHVNALYIWIPLCLLFIAPFFDFRRPLSLLHLDLLVLLSFSVSLAFFNHANIWASVPLVYPPLLYLLARMLWLLRRRASGAPPPRPLRLLIPAPWLAVAVVFLIGFRVGLNVTDSNVIDVGYAGVIGAQRITADRPLYGGFPADNEHGDTYGPFNYEAYVPFQQIFGWSGRWDDLPAAHGAAIFFDLLAVGLLFLLGRRMRGPTPRHRLRLRVGLLSVHVVRAREQRQRHAGGGRRAGRPARRQLRLGPGPLRPRGLRRAGRPDQARPAGARADPRHRRPARAAAAPAGRAHWRCSRRAFWCWAAWR